jgi:hypothetical protein
MLTEHERQAAIKAAEAYPPGHGSAWCVTPDDNLGDDIEVIDGIISGRVEGLLGPEAAVAACRLPPTLIGDHSLFEAYFDVVGACGFDDGLAYMKTLSHDPQEIARRLREGQ